MPSVNSEKKLPENMWNVLRQACSVRIFILVIFIVVTQAVYIPFVGHPKKAKTPEWSVDDVCEWYDIDIPCCNCFTSDLKSNA